MANAFESSTESCSADRLASANTHARRAAVPGLLLTVEDGQSFAEYALILALVIVVAAAGLGPIGTGLGGYIVTTIGALVAML